MRLLDGKPVYSPSDLVGFAACEHLTQLELAATRGGLERPQREDPLLDVLTRRGGEHEAGLLAGYPSEPGHVVEIERETRNRAGLEAAAAETTAAMQAGAPVIYQAAFFHDGWVGYADFLERVELPSALGEWSYEVVDAKLARNVRALALVQLCEYSQQLARIQGRVPEHVHVTTGDGVRHSFRLADYAAYHRTLKTRFLATTEASTPAATYPDPVDHCHICRWWAVCGDRRRSDDHLSRVAGMGRSQRKRLVAASIVSRRALGNGPNELPHSGINASTYEKLHLQAALQLRGEGLEPPLHELLPPEAVDDAVGPRGFAALPPPSAGDLFLDLEGDPYALDGGLEYLFGIVEVVDGATKYYEFWAHTRSEERAAFQRAVDLIAERRDRYPNMHVYHYAPYEPSAFRRLMGAHGTREDEIDDLLRGNVFVDLYRVVRQAVRVSTESYGLKQIEKLYFTRPGGAVMDAGSSIITYERYLVDHDRALLDEIAAYNRDDCESLIGLQRWLETQRTEAAARYGPIARPTPPEPAAEDVEPGERAALTARLLEGVAEDATERTDEMQGRYLLAHLLEWHRREAKPTWWRFFDRLNYEPEQFTDDSECIGGLELDEIVGTVKRSTVYRMRFEPQDHKFSVGADVFDPATGKSAGTLTAIDEAGTLEFKRGRTRNNDPLPRAFMPGGPFNTDLQRAAVAAVAESVADHGIEGDGPYQAVRDLLLRRPPRLSTTSGAALRASDEEVLDSARRLALTLDGGCLAIQGPPGAGKTFTGARMIVALLAKGKRVGITATTHGAIGNLLTAVVEAAAECGVTVNAMQKADEGQATVTVGVQLENDAATVEAALTSGTVQLVAGTSWLWARAGLRDSVDVLVIDEAGQMSLADVTAVGTAARNLVLLGDPQQLSQPSQGSHPLGAEVSALQHLLGEHATIPDDRGLFLDVTYRMHPSVCAYISEIAYDNRLEAAPDRELQTIDGAAGLWFVPVRHAGNNTRSEEEAAAVAELVDGLLGAPWIDHHGNTRALGLGDILVIAPYNAHVAKIKARLAPGVRVGTVDKFQGREGAVAIYSMASSSAEEAPRGMSFLYDLHRLNVAVSRARARAYIVASPELLRVLCHTPEQLRLANALCRFVEVAT